MVIHLSKKVLAIASGILALFVIVVMASPAHAESCVDVTLLSTGLKACVPVSQLPTVTTRVTLPRLTVTDEVTKIVKVPGPTVRLPGRTVTVPGAAGGQSVRTVTVTKNVPQPVTTRNMTQMGTRQTVRVTDTITASPVTSTVAVEKIKAVKTPPKDAVVLTKIKAAGLSLLLVLLGVLLAVGIAWAAFTYGWFSGDNGNRKFIKETLDDLRYNK